MVSAALHCCATAVSALLSIVLGRGISFLKHLLKILLFLMYYLSVL